LPVINNIKIEHITPQSVKLHLVGVPTTKSDNPDDPANFNEIRVVINAPVSSHRSEPLIIERKQRRKPGSSTVEPLLIENLICGEHYTLQTFTVFHGVLSKPSAVQRFIADIPPNMPESPVVSVKNHPPRIEIHVKSPEANEGTLATKFRIYHTNSDNFLVGCGPCISSVRCQSVGRGHSQHSERTMPS
jgi:hypothetical protein